MLFKRLQPVKHIDEKARIQGLQMLLYSGASSQVMVMLTGGAMLAAFALLLGASNKTIGLIAAIGPFAQIMQLPAIYLVNRLRRRKLLVTASTFCSRLLWVMIAVLPILAPAPLRIPLFLLFLLVLSCLNAIADCSWNSWIRDFVPEDIRSTYFARRMAIATAAGAAASIVAGLCIDRLKGFFELETGIYTVLFLVGVFAGYMSLFFLSGTSEPEMADTGKTDIIALLKEPFANRNFVNLLKFLGSWNFAINLAAPFFTIYLLKRLEFSMSWVIGLSVLSQMVNVLFFRIWGKLANRYSNKSVLSVSGLLFVLCIAMWPFTTMPDRHILTIPLIILIHLLTGMSTAGVALCSGNIALKMAPYGRATSYLAVNGIINGLAATIAPISAGFTADWFELRQLKLTFTWISEKNVFNLPAIDLRGLDFLFIIAFILGLYALHRLLAIREEGEADKGEVVDGLLTEMRQGVRQVSTVAGMKYLLYLPYLVVDSIVNEKIEKIRKRKRKEFKDG